MGRMGVVALVVVGFACACGSAGDRSGAAVRDSAGVRIVENPAVTSAIPEWTLAQHPLLDVGVVEGPEEYRLFRVSDAKRLADGGVLVVNSGSQQVRRYDSSGTFLSAFGRKGEGPGEFRVPTWLFLVQPDTIAVWDPRLRRIALFTLDGTFVRNVRPAGQAANPDLVAAFDDGTFLIRDERFNIPASGFAESQFTLVRYSPLGAFVDSAGTYFRGMFGHLGDVGMVGGPVFSPGGAMAASRNAFWVGTGRTYEVRDYTSAGTLETIVRWEGPSRDVHPEDVNAYWSQRMADATGNDLRRLERMREVTPVSDQFPAYGWLESASDGGLWVQQYPRPRAPDATAWWAFKPDGTMMATVTVPSSLRITDVGTDAVLGIERDSLDVEHVRLYGIDRP